MEIDKWTFDHILKKLEDIRDSLVKTGDITGANQRVLEMKEEIKQIGWSGIVKKYHPDINENIEAHELFKMYRFVYENMIKNKEI